MKQKTLAVLCAALAAFWALPAEVPAAEVLLKVANLENRAISRYVSSGGSFFSRETGFFSELLRALDSGIVQGPVLPNDLDHIQSESLRKLEVRDPDPAVRALFAAPGKLVGRQAAADGSGWDKFIIHCSEAEGGRGPYLAEIGRGDAEIAFIAVGNEDGELERWRISETPPRSSDRAVAFSIQKPYFMQQILQPSARSWLDSLVPKTGSLGVIVLRKPDPQGSAGYTDSALLWVTPPALPQPRPRLQTVCLVIGWQTPEPQKRPSEEKEFRWIWQQ